MSRLKVSPSNPQVKRILATAFPDYRGRKVWVDTSGRKVDVTSYWDGGSRHYWVALDLRTPELRSMPVSQNGTPYDGGPLQAVTVPEGAALVERFIFQGTEAGVTIHLAEADAQRLLPGVS